MCQKTFNTKQHSNLILCLLLYVHIKSRCGIFSVSHNSGKGCGCKMVIFVQTKVCDGVLQEYELWSHFEIDRYTLMSIKLWIVGLHSPVSVSKTTSFWSFSRTIFPFLLSASSLALALSPFVLRLISLILNKDNSAAQSWSFTFIMPPLTTTSTHLHKIHTYTRAHIHSE